MSLKRKLIIAFCVMVFLPLLLMGIVMGTIGNRQLKTLEEHTQSYYKEVAEDGTLILKEGDHIYHQPSEMVMPEVWNFVRSMFFTIVLILIMTGILLLLWIYSEINVPIHKLRTATRNIADGNLNFTLEAEGDDEISDLCRDFEEMRKRLLESTQEKMEYDRQSKELVSNISHDLKTPITAIKGYVEGIMDGVADTPEKMERYIRTIYNKANDMDRLINELTLYSKIDTNRIPYVFHKINVGEYFEDCYQALKLDLVEKGYQIDYTNTVDSEVEVIADAEQIKRVIDNIISNSIKYMDKEPGHIGLRVRDVGDFIQVEIEDNGRGMSMKELPYIFERFYRTDASRNSATGGSGIGLSIVKKIIEDHNGKIWASSVEGVGTTMFFVLRKYQEVPA